MSKVVEVPGLGVIEFPDEMDDATIAAAIQKQLGGDTSGKVPMTLGGFGQNLMRSATDFGTGIINAVTNLPETIGALTGSLRVPFGTLGPGGMAAGAKTLEQQGDVAEAVGKQAKARYGSGDKALRTAYEDPVGMLGDVSMITGVGGGLPGRMGRAMTAVSRATDPIGLPFRAASAAIPKSVTTPIAEKLYHSTLKPSKSGKPVEENLEISRTGLREKVKLPDPENARVIIDEIQRKLDAEIASKTAAGATVDAEAAINSAVAPIVQRYRFQPEIVEALENFRKVRLAGLPTAPFTPVGFPGGQAFPVGGMSAVGTGRAVQPLPLDEAVHLRRTSREGIAFGERGTPKEQAAKGISREIGQQEYRKLSPGARAQADRERLLIDLEDEMNRQANVYARQGPASMSAGVLGNAAGNLINAPVGVSLGLTEQALRKMPELASGAAIRMYHRDPLRGLLGGGTNRRTLRRALLPMALMQAERGTDEGPPISLIELMRSIQ